MSVPDLANHISIQLVNERPIPKDPLAFFNFKTEKRNFYTITDQIQVWKDDLQVAVKLFVDLYICPTRDRELHTEALDLTRVVLKERMKYPGVKENPELEKIAKTWIPPSKVHQGPDANVFLNSSDETQTVIDCSGIHVLKIEVSDGSERRLLYSILDAGFRPSLLIVKWSHDLDEHVHTAHCAGHLLNSGYNLIHLENGYALYYYNDQPLYDICSMKIPALSNPILQAILESVAEKQKEVPTKLDS